MMTLTPYSADQERAILAVGTVRAKRSDLGAVLAVAAAAAGREGQPRYVFATAHGYAIDTSPPPATQAHYVMHADGYRLVNSRPWE